MVRALPILSAAFALLLAGCGESVPAPAQEQQAAPTRIRNPDNERLRALSDSLQRVTLVRAIRETRNRCPRSVESHREQGEYRGMAYWTARCDDNSQWAIFLAPNGDVQVRNCAHMQQLGLPACSELPPAPPQPPQRRPQPRPKAGD